MRIVRLTHLCMINVGRRALVNPRRRFTEIGVFRLSTTAHDVALDYLIQEEWHTKFVALRYAATETLNDDRDARLETERLEDEAKLAKAFASLDRLVDDNKFVRLPTQKAMLAYAKEQVPELADVDEADLKARIQDLKARITAKYG